MSRRPVLCRFGVLVTLAVVASVGAAIAAIPPTFPTKRLVNTVVPGLLPFDVRTEDIDQDGDLDIYTANYSGRLSWFEQAPGNPPVWIEHIVTEFMDGAESVIAAKVDGDADFDFVFAAFNREEVGWFENGGNGNSWTEHPITFDCRLCVDTWAADVDGDNDIDVLSASGFDGKILWYENRGNNLWTGRLLPTTASSVAAADMDRDGDVDAIAGIAWNDSNGAVPPKFKSRLIGGFPTAAEGIAVIDLDRDGDLDLLSSGQEDDLIAWFENDGALPPGWTSRVISTTADFATSVYAADLDGDGDMDVLSSSFFDNTIAWYENNGASPPVWTERAVSTAAPGARSVFAADLDKDGDMDVISATQNDQKVIWHVNDANYADGDGDGRRNDLDCVPSNGAAFAIPQEVRSVRFRTKTLFEWNSAALSAGPGTTYDVMRGLLSQLPPGTGAGETCLVNNGSPTTFTDAVTPPAGSGFYYLVRASNACGVGGYGARSNGVPRTTAVCP